MSLCKTLFHSESFDKKKTRKIIPGINEFVVLENQILPAIKMRARYILVCKYSPVIAGPECAVCRVLKNAQEVV